MRNSLRASILTLLLAASTYAGVMQGGTPAPPPPEPTPTMTEQEPEGGVMQGGQPETDTQILLTLLNSLLSLL